MMKYSLIVLDVDIAFLILYQSGKLLISSKNKNSTSLYWMWNQIITSNNIRQNSQMIQVYCHPTIFEIRYQLLYHLKYVQLKYSFFDWHRWLAVLLCLLMNSASILYLCVCISLHEYFSVQAEEHAVSELLWIF